MSHWSYQSPSSLTVTVRWSTVVHMDRAWSEHLRDGHVYQVRVFTGTQSRRGI